MKLIYIYATLAIITIFAMSVLKGGQEGFTMVGKWYTSEYFVVPLFLTIFIGPLTYYIYVRVLRTINKTLTSKPSNSNSNT